MMFGVFWTIRHNTGSLQNVTNLANYEILDVWHLKFEKLVLNILSADTLESDTLEYMRYMYDLCILVNSLRPSDAYIHASVNWPSLVQMIVCLLGRRQARLQWSLKRNSYILFKKTHFQMSSAKWRSGLNVLKWLKFVSSENPINSKPSSEWIIV